MLTGTQTLCSVSVMASQLVIYIHDQVPPAYRFPHNKLAQAEALECLAIANKGTMLLQNNGDHSTIDIKSHPRGPESTTTLLWNPQFQFVS